MEEGETNMCGDSPLPPGKCSESSFGVCGSRVVMLAGSTGGVSDALVSALEERDADVIVVADAPSVMVELANRATDAVVLVNGDGRPWVTELLDAVATYYPATTCVRHSENGSNTGVDSGGDSALRGFRDARGGGGRVTRRPSPAAVQRVRRRVQPLAVKLAAGVSEDMPSPLITEAELAMLLGPAEQDADWITQGEPSAS